MESLAFTHSQEAHEVTNLDPSAYELKVLQLNWKPASSAWLGMTAVIMAVSIMSASGAMAAYVRTNGNALNVRSSPGGAVVGSIANGSSVSLSGKYSNGWAELSNGNWVASRWVRNGNGGGGGGGTPSGVYGPGSRGSGVSNLQTRLRQLGFFRGSSTGYYGSVTTSAVRSFQSARGLRVDGVAGPRTLAALGSSNGGGSGGGSPNGSVRVSTNGTALNVRKGPGLGYRVTGSLSNGSTVRTSGRTSGGWIQLASGGWVSSGYVR